jgi:hypothetical protein
VSSVKQTFMRSAYIEADRRVDAGSPDHSSSARVVELDTASGRLNVSRPLTDNVFSFLLFGRTTALVLASVAGPWLGMASTTTPSAAAAARRTATPASTPVPAAAGATAGAASRRASPATRLAHATPLRQRRQYLARAGRECRAALQLDALLQIAQHLGTAHSAVHRGSQIRRGRKRKK